LKFRAVAEKTANNFSVLLFAARGAASVCPPVCYSITPKGKNRYPRPIYILNQGQPRLVVGT